MDILLLFNESIYLSIILSIPNDDLMKNPIHSHHCQQNTITQYIKNSFLTVILLWNTAKLISLDSIIIQLHLVAWFLQAKQW